MITGSRMFLLEKKYSVSGFLFHLVKLHCVNPSGFPVPHQEYQLEMEPADFCVVLLERACP